VFVAVGSNVAPAERVRQALIALEREFGLLRRSAVYACPAEGFEGDDFLNLVVAFDSERQPFDIIQRLHDIEDECGRVRDGVKFGPRSMDLDLLLYGDLVSGEAGLRLPRPDLLLYAHVLGPMAELAATRLHPVTGRSFAAHWAGFPPERKNLQPFAL